ncbi:AbrB/MazE/SpoVT family DNA-binding domain-containing protein [Bacillus cereus]|uniref:AbrB/MazE/SpoVT family DNA-binding domain-containing protein n=1 Tax=Bacillus cereus TaxID=1396 RepID=UPI0023E3A745|nr:AbrB/MazE/SpoVT family DNA-binding domain-containing protein [Bacillus cereus]MDF3555517.1 AbrB/MazE/SpoVT family DNA-binding domain-containing protein [Bacillus cereus]
MKRKLRKIGNSTGLILPKEILEEMDLYDGDSVEIIYNSIKKEIVLRNEKRPPTSDESEIEGVVVKVLKDKGLI